MQNDNPIEVMFDTIAGIARNNQSPKIGIGKVSGFLRRIVKITPCNFRGGNMAEIFR